ncbi:MAG: helix-turn-helix domain-containing protein [Prevotellaceae bacterium]|nr:helix-turn-helix domain-containing protein [Prevotellaceae bacterium]
MNKSITAKIKKLRVEKGYTQEEMAEKLNITRSAYSNIEQGDAYSWSKYLNDLMIILDTTPKDFFNDIGNQIINQNNYEGAVGYVEILHQETKEIYEKLIASKDEQIAFFKDRLEKAESAK